MDSLDAPIQSALVVAGTLVVLEVVVRLALRVARRPRLADDLRRITTPLRAGAVALLVFVYGATEEMLWLQVIGRIAGVVAVTWFVLRSLRVVQELLHRRFDVSAADNAYARFRRTQFDIVRRAVGAIVVIVAGIVLLLTVTGVREVGPTIVAYGGLIAAVLGLALRSPLENYAAGLALAFTENLRIDDVVVIEGEWGRIEHLGLVSAVVRIWDDRTLVVPISRFVNGPYENWTHRTSELTGSVLAWVDYDTDLDALRHAVDAKLAQLPRFDGRASVVQVVELGEHAVQVRVLATARDAQDCWDLRCELREGILEFLSDDTDRLPVIRLDGHRPPTAVAAGG